MVLSTERMTADKIGSMVALFSTSLLITLREESLLDMVY